MSGFFVVVVFFLGFFFVIWNLFSNKQDLEKAVLENSLESMKHQKLKWVPC